VNTSNKGKANLVLPAEVQVEYIIPLRYVGWQVQ
jgi:hypothetical protein